MTMFHTMQGSYEPFFATDLTAPLNTTYGRAASDVSYFLDGSTSGRTQCFSDKPALAREIGPEWNYVESIFTMKNCITSEYAACKIWGYSKGGPAELICSICVKSSMVKFNATTDATHSFWGGAITMDVNNHIGDITCLSPASACSIGKLRFDLAGYRWILFDPYEITVGDGTLFFNAWIRPY
jgi:hypothetical protein